MTLETRIKALEMHHSTDDGSCHCPVTSYDVHLSWGEPEPAAEPKPCPTCGKVRAPIFLSWGDDDDTGD